MNLVEQLPPNLSGLEQLHKLMQSGGRPPIGDTLDFTLVEASEGFAAFESVPSLRAYNPIGTVHGGYAATLLDSACGCAAHSRLSPTQAYTTLELKVLYHKAITHETGTLRAEGRVISIGRRAAFAEATLKDSTGKLYASATSTLLVIDKLA
ncbi:PaaI family thioesterase [Paraburkholderia caledonica]|uniref:PaaI family thioesterase n=1 Tax=Paraburkholderia caledonica TaxID=134536 RepID=UPI000B48ADC7|nr:thioesterase [Burkholderia sp. Bk]